jgi:hypothetical protein
MATQNRIVDPRTIANNVARTYHLDNVTPRAVHIFAEKNGWTLRKIGGKRGYLVNIESLIASKIDQFKKCIELANMTPKPKVNPDNVNVDRNHEPAGKIDYEWELESKISRYIMEAVDELELFHGSPHDFEEFDFAYMSSGFGKQMFGYGAYLTTSYECAKETYSQGKNVYTVEIPDKGYLSNEKITPAYAMKVARIFFNYYTKEHEFGREAYVGNEDEFWENECKYIGQCRDGKHLYGTISSILGSDKDTSEFLYNKIGLKGLVWVETNGSTGEKFKNYVMFNPKDIKIIKKDSSV